MSESSIKTSPRLSLTYRIFLCLILAALLLPALRTLNFSARMIAHPWSLDREEGFILNQAMRLAEWESIYPPIDEYPFIVGNYTPVYPAIYAVAIQVFPDSLGTGRFLVLLSVLTIALIQVIWVWKSTRRWEAALLAPVLFLIAYSVCEWIVFARVDFPALAFGFAGLFTATREGNRPRRLLLAGVLFVLAFYTKQTQVLAPAAALGGLLWRREWKPAAWLAGPAIGLAALLGLILLLVTGGEFWKHTVTYNENIFEWSQVWVWLKTVWLFSGPVLVAAALAVALLVIAKKRSEVSVPPALLFYLGLGTLSILMIGKAGAASNYLLEFQLAATTFLAMSLGKFLQGLKEKRSLALAIGTPLILILLAIHAVLIWMPFRRYVLFQQNWPTPQEQELADIVFGEVMDAQGEVISEDPLPVLKCNKEVLYQPFIMSQLAREGKWDQQPFLDDLENGRFALIVSTQKLDQEGHFWGWTLEMREAILGAYRLKWRAGITRDVVYFYEPLVSP